MKSIFITILFFCAILCSCKKKTIAVNELLCDIYLSEIEYNIDQEELARVEGIQCNDSSLIVFDYHSGESYTLFDVNTAQCYGRFGQIGQGPDEIMLGCPGILSKDVFSIFFNPTGFVAKYNVDSLRLNIHSKLRILTKYNIQDAVFSQICTVNDSIFLGAGVYNSEFQYALFDKTNTVLDYNIGIYNAKDFNFNMFHKFLSNQGRLRKHPDKNRFVYSLKNSANIDFFEITERNKILPIKILRHKNPVYKPIQNNNMLMVVPDLNCEIGYIDLTVCSRHVYALYTDKKVTESYCSNIILVYDWNGNLVEKYRLSHEVYYIAINERLNKLFAVVKDEDGGWDITSFALE
jgi:hypothetical protein